MTTLFRRSAGAVPAAALLALALAACGSDKKAGPGSTDPYAYTPPPAAAAPAGLDPASWTAHLTGDLAPYWAQDAAKGTPTGNFPTYRTMMGATTANGARKPRMMGRQTFAYAVEYLMTGDEQALGLARAGAKFLEDHAWDAAVGGWYADLDATGAPSGTGDKLAQDFSYPVMGPAAYFYVSRDPAAEAAVLATRDLLFDPAKYWDAPNQRIKDGMNAALTAEAYMSGAGSWELVAQLDPVTAFMLLAQPALSDPARRAQLLGDLRTLGTTMKDRFFQDGFMWGTTATKGVFGSRHADFGHGLKAYWALTQIDKRLDDRPFASFVSTNAPANVQLAVDPFSGFWGNRPTSSTTAAYGSDWWIYAEADQFTATLAMHDPAKWLPTLAVTAPGFVTYFVDRTIGREAAKEVYASINRSGGHYNWADTDTSKCNEWKSGFHSHEHALVMYLFSHWLAGTPAPLYFAFPADQIDALAARTTPYTFQGKVSKVEDLGPIASDPDGRHKVRVSFSELR